MQLDWPDTPIRDASTVVLLRNHDSNPSILLGRRGARAVFMPNKFVFPGGGVEAADAQSNLIARPAQKCLRRLLSQCKNNIVDSLLTCAVREVWEETGLMLARRSPSTSRSMSPFGNPDYAPSAKGMQFVYRAITPPGQKRRFDARFFLVNLEDADLVGHPDDFSQATTELSDLQWIHLSKACELDVPLITRFVIEHISTLLKAGEGVKDVPFRWTQERCHHLEML